MWRSVRDVKGMPRSWRAGTNEERARQARYTHHLDALMTAAGISGLWQLPSPEAVEDMRAEARRLTAEEREGL